MSWKNLPTPSKLTIIGSDNGLSPGCHQTIIWPSAGILLIRPLGTNFNETLIEIHTFSFKKIHLKMLSGKWRPFCLCLNVLITKKMWIGKVFPYLDVIMQHSFVNLNASVNVWWMGDIVNCWQITCTWSSRINSGLNWNSRGISNGH